MRDRSVESVERGIQDTLQQTEISIFQDIIIGRLSNNILSCPFFILKINYL